MKFCNEVAHFLHDHPAAVKVYYPGLEDTEDIIEDLNTVLDTLV